MLTYGLHGGPTPPLPTIFDLFGLKFLILRKLVEWQANNLVIGACYVACFFAVVQRYRKLKHASQERLIPRVINIYRPWNTRGNSTKNSGLLQGGRKIVWTCFGILRYCVVALLTLRSNAVKRRNKNQARQNVNPTDSSLLLKYPLLYG